MSATITARGYTVPSLTESGTLPAGVTFTDNGNGTATIKGTPAPGSGGRYPVTLTAANQLGTTGEAYVVKVDEPPAITSQHSAAATIGDRFSFLITTTGYPAPKITETGVLPAGISLGSGGLTGTPKRGTSGTYPITIAAASTAGTVTQNFTLTVS